MTKGHRVWIHVVKIVWSDTVVHLTNPESLSKNIYFKKIEV